MFMDIAIRFNIIATIKNALMATVDLLLFMLL